MRDVELALRKAYKDAIAASGAGVAMYYGAAPNNATANYILFKSISTNDQSTKTSSDIDVTVNLEVYTKAMGSNSGETCADIANEILNAIYPTPGYNLDLSEFQIQCFKTSLVSNESKSWTLDNELVYVDRTISFRHKIYIQE